MGDRVARTAEKAGLDGVGVALVTRAHQLAMSLREPERGGLPSDHHPAYLHPGRTGLILMEDLAERDPRVVALGILAESRDLSVRVDPAQVDEVCGPEATGWWRALPIPGWHGSEDGSGGDGVLSDGALLEALVVAPAPVQRVALAEALDQVRHAHLWESPEERRRALELVEGVFAPVAPRVDPVVDRRFAWWLRRVGPGLV
jgi:hypothetical protein